MTIYNSVGMSAHGCDTKVESVASEQQSKENSISQASNHYDSRLVSVVSFLIDIY